MAKPARAKAKARRLYEYDGISQESIGEIIGVSRKTIENWMAAAGKTGDPWVKGKFSQELREKEEAAKVRAIEAAGWSEGRVLAEIGALAGSDIKDFFEVDSDGVLTLKDLKKLGDKTKAISCIRQRKTMRKDGRGNDADTLEDTHTEIRTHDKLGALVKLGEHLGLFKTEAQKQEEAGVLAYYREQLRKKRGGVK